MKYLAATLLSITGVASAAQQVLWGQCGGEGYTGPTECVEGAVCQYTNQWYSQCVTGTATTTAGVTTTATPTSTTASTSKTASTTISQTSTQPVSTSTGFASVSGTKFTIDGEANYFAGTNSYWISFLTNNADVDTALDALVNSGLKILRIWGFNDVTSDPGSGTVYFQLLSASGSTINTGTNGLQRLDYIVSAAESRGLKLIINFVNYWDDYGGMNAYVQAFGLSSKTDWYTSDVAQTQYKTYIQAVVSRYVDSSAILAWELANEPRCNGCSTDVIFNWASEASAYIKSLDSNHMVTLGDEGFGLPGDGTYPYQYTEGTDFVKNLGIETLDFATFHLYPTSWGQSNDWGSAWVKAHGDACATQGVPCLLEEYGSTTDHCTYETPWQNMSLTTEGMAADLFWQLGTTLSTGQTADDGFTIYTGTDDWTCIVTDHVAAINALS